MPLCPSQEYYWYASRVASYQSECCEEPQKSALHWLEEGAKQKETTGPVIYQ
jgi:hypothetical protein